MAIYVIGDLQGCLTPLQQLLDKLQFDPARDQLWFVGDIVNRGPQSLETLRFIRDLGTSAITLLGNHDLHLLAVAFTGRKSKGKDTLDAILQAHDRDLLLHWLRTRPLLHVDPKIQSLMVHAGIPPQWSIEDAALRAREVEDELAGENFIGLLEAMYSDQPDRWSDDLTPQQRMIYTINAFTRMRYLTADGRMEFKHKCSPARAGSDLIPWFAVPRSTLGACVYFGHWSTLGIIELDTAYVHAYAMDTGCLWGGQLTAIRADGAHRPKVSVGCPQTIRPGKEE